MKKIATILFLLPMWAFATLMVGSQSVTVSDATPRIVDTSNRKFPITVSVIPQSGTTATVLYSNTPDAALNAASANWAVLGTISGVSTANTVTLPSPVTAIQFQKISGASAVIGEINWNQ